MRTWTTSDVDKGLLEVQRVRPHVLSYFNTLITNYHGWNESDEYCDILAGEWIEFFCHTVLIAKKEIDSGKKIFNLAPIEVCGDLSEFSRNRTYREDLYKNLLSVTNNLMEKKIDEFKFERKSIRVRIGNKEGIREKAVRLIGARKSKLLIVSPYYKCSNLQFFKALFKWRHWACLNNLHFQYSRNIEIDSEERLRLSREVNLEGENIDGILALIKSMLPLYLPAILFEDLNNFREHIKSLNLHRPLIVYSSNALHGNLVFKQLFLLWKKSGTKLLYHQHGGGYGLDKINTFENYEKRVVDIFMTWGWRDDTPNLVDMTPPNISQFPYKKRANIAIICADFPKIPFRLHYHPMPGSIERMHEMTIDFISNLNSKRNVWLKPYYIDYGWDSVKKIKNMISTKNVKNISSFKIYAQSKLVIHNYLGTSYLETMSLNIPTICVIDNQTYEFRDSARDFFGEFVEKKIFHFSGGGAADFINEMLEAGNLESWWKSEDIQRLRLRFIKQYANFSTNWQNNLEKFFLNQISCLEDYHNV